MLDLLSLLPLQSPSSSPTKVSQHHAMISCFCVRYYWRVMDTEHRFSLPTRRLILNCLVPLLGSATMEQQRVPAKHLRLVQLLRIRLRQVMLRYRVAWFSEAALILVVFGRWYNLASLVSSDSFPLLCLFSLTIYLSYCTTTNNKHQAPTSSPTTSDPTVVSSVAVGVQLHSGLWNVDLVLCTCAYASLFIANSSSHSKSSACFSRICYNGSATMTQSSVAFNKESQPSTYG